MQGPNVSFPTFSTANIKSITKRGKVKSRFLAFLTPNIGASMGSLPFCLPFYKYSTGRAKEGNGKVTMA